MNEKINLQDLSSLLAEKAAITKKEAEMFFRAYFEIMNEELIKSGLLKIKELGVFKLSLMEDRESIDVTTGERVLIPAHYKVIFTPDKKLADTVNEPFAIFETVEIEGELESEELKILSEEDTSKDSGYTSEDEEEIDIEKESAPADEEGINIEKELTAEEGDGIDMEKDSTTEDKEEIDSDEAPSGKMKPKPVYWNEKDCCLNCHDYKAHRVYKKKYYKVLKKSDKQRTTIFILSILLACTLGFIVYLYQFEIRNPYKRLSNAIEITDSVSENYSSPEVLATLADSITPAEEPKEKETNDIIPLPETLEKPKQITIASGQRLTSIAQDEYGDKVFWIYIYLENKAILPNPNILPVGAKIILPPAEKYGINSNDPASIQKAKEIAKNP